MPKSPLNIREYSPDSDREDLSHETLESQFEIVRNETTTSRVEQFGNLTISKSKVGEFMGELGTQRYIFDLEGFYKCRTSLKV